MSHTQKTERFMELEGLRGVAAIMVALYHNLIAFYAFAFFGGGTILATVANSHFESVIHGNPLMAFVSGSFAVALFFVLSGFVLSIGFFQTHKETIIKKLATKRYLRLMLPALASVMICYLFIKFGLGHTQAAAPLTRSGWLGLQWNFAPHVFDAFTNASFGIFATGQSVYNNVLWTMMIEFAGSFLVFGSLLLFGRSRHRWVMYLFLLAATFSGWFLGFVLGMILADLTAGGIIQRKARKWWMSAPLIAAGLYFGGYPFSGTVGTPYDFLAHLPFAKIINPLSFYTVIGAVIIVGLVVASTQITRALAAKPISKLGKYTFSLYLVHLPILFTFTTFAFIHLRHHFGYNVSVAVALVASVPLVAGATYLFERYVDMPSIRFSGYLAAIYLGDKEVPAFIRKAPRLVPRWVVASVSRLRWQPPEPSMVGEEAVD